MKRGGLLLALTLALIVPFAACGGGDDKPSNSGSTESDQDVIRERDGVELHLSVDEAVYGPDDPVRVRAAVKNTTGAPVSYAGLGPQDAGFKLTVVSELAGEQPLGDVSDDQISGTLEAGEEIALEREWDKRLLMKVTPPLAPPGTYTVNAVFLMARAGFADPVKLASAVRFDVEDTPFVQPPLAVVTALVSDERVKAWAEGRGVNVVCAYPPRQLFYNGDFVSNAAAETFDFLYTSQQQNGDPICGIAIEDDSWILVLFANKGEEPHRLTVWIALDRQVVLEVTEGGPTPVPTATP